MSTDLQEALTAAQAAPLVAKRISPVLLEYQRRYAPLVRTLPSESWDSTVYYFNKRVSLPGGGFVTDGGAYNGGVPSTSQYNQENFQIRLLQSIGAVTGYAQAVTRNLIGDLRAREIEGAARGLYWDIETALLWGASAPTTNTPAPQFDGFDVLCSSFSNVSYTSGGTPGPGIGSGAIDNYAGAQGVSGAATPGAGAGWGGSNYNPWTDGQDQNAIDLHGTNLSLGSLDLLIDLVENNVAEPVENNEWEFLMSPAANSRLSQLLINQQRFVDTVEIAPGLIVPTYRGIPVVKTSFLSARTNQFGAITATASATVSGGTALTSGTQYNYYVAPVIARFGEIQASQVSSVTPSGSNLAASVALPSSVTGPEGSLPTHFKVYRSTGTAPSGIGSTGNTGLNSSSNVPSLVGMVAYNYTDTSGNTRQTTTIIDTGWSLQPYDGTHAAATNQYVSYYYGNASLKPLTGSGEQSIYLVSRDPNYIVRPYVREMQPVNIYPTTASPDALPFAFVADTTLAVRATKYMGRLANVLSALDSTAGNGILPTTTSYVPNFKVD